MKKNMKKLLSSVTGAAMLTGGAVQAATAEIGYEVKVNENVASYSKVAHVNGDFYFEQEAIAQKIKQLEASNSEKDAALAEKDSEIAKKDSELKEQASEIAEKNSELKAQAFEIAEKDSEIAEKDALLKKYIDQFGEFKD